MNRSDQQTAGGAHAIQEGTRRSNSGHSTYVLLLPGARRPSKLSEISQVSQLHPQTS